MINERFRINILGDLELEDLCADVYFDDKILFVLTQELGYENMEIEVYPPPHGQKFWHFKMSEFEEVILYAKNRLWELRKMPEDNG